MPLTGPEIVLYEKKGPIAYITLNRPERLNALSLESYQLLREIEADFAADDEILVAVYTGAGDRAFCAGMDLQEFTKRSGDRTSGLSFKGAEHYKPTIAAVNGYALGGGCELALYCDIRIASENARFGLPEVKWSLFPISGVYDLPRLISRSDAMYLCLTGADIDAQEALRLGLVSKVVPQGELQAEAARLAQTICENGPLAVRAVKRLIKEGGELPRDYVERLGKSLHDLVYNSEDAQEGATAFAERRKPQFRGK